MSESEKLSLIVTQGFDRNNVAFTAFMLCTEKQKQDIDDAKKTGESLNISKFNIIHTTIGHNIDARTQNDVKQYLRLKYNFNWTD